MKTVILLRHADIDAPPSGPAPDNHPLNAAGQARAQALAHVVGTAGVGTVYVSPAHRTQKTAEPLATALGVTPIQTPALSTFASQIAAAGAGAVILVVGHSNTVPDLIAALGAASPVPLVQGHDDLFVATLGTGSPQVLRLKYGAPPVSVAPTG